MANTRDILGDRETAEALISGTLETFEDSDIGKFNSDAFEYLNIKSITLPNLIDAGSSICYGCYYLEVFDAPEMRTVGSNAFSGCYQLNYVNMDNVATVQAYTFYRSGVGKVILPSCTAIYNEVFDSSRVGTVDFHQNITFRNSTFEDDNYLCQLILRSTSLCQMTVSPTTMFSGTPFKYGIGWIYVPSDLVETYKTATGWSNYAEQIVSIDEYPKPLQDETIEDSWEDIFESIDNGTYINKYVIGDIKYVDIGGTWLAMEIVAFDKDITTSNETAPITWISRDILQSCSYNTRMQPSNDWANSNIRSYLRNRVFPTIDPVVKDRILEVQKFTNTVSTTSSSTETIWLPSYREMIGNTNTTYCEPNGVDYIFPFSSSERRKKKRGMVNALGSYWLRTKTGTNYGAVIGTSGGSTNSSTSTTSYGIVIGFCT